MFTQISCSSGLYLWISTCIDFDNWATKYFCRKNTYTLILATHYDPQPNQISLKKQETIQFSMNYKSAWKVDLVGKNLNKRRGNFKKRYD